MKKPKPDLKKVMKAAAGGTAKRPFRNEKDAGVVDKWMPQYLGNEKARGRVVTPEGNFAIKKLRKQYGRGT